MLNPAVRAALAQHAQAFREARPFRHVVIDGFFEPAVAERLLQAFPGFDARYALNEMGQVGGKAVREAVRDLPEPYPQLDAWLQTPDFLGSIGRITGIPDLLYDADYVGGGTHENVHGQSLDMHIDFNRHPGNRTHRRLNLIVYLNHEWDEAWGGCLQLAEDPWDPSNRNRLQVAPLFNRGVIFETTEHSWHGFERIQLPEDKRHLSRRSFAIYLYTRERPAEETAPSHATVYVPEFRPDHLVVGHTLSQHDVDELDRRFAAARGQLQYLYGREKDFARQLDNAAHALDEARAAARIDLLGYARQSGAPEGVWPDGWAGPQARLRCVPEQRCTGATLRVWAPADRPGPGTLTLRVNDAVVEARLRAGDITEIDLPLRVAAGTPVDITLEAGQHWVPAEREPGGDDRQLAFRLLDLRLRHG